LKLFFFLFPVGLSLELRSPSDAPLGFCLNGKPALRG